MSSAARTGGAAPIVRRRGRGRPSRQYKCQHCARSFKRSEHCIRHERTHTREKPFVCRYCRKSYSRKDQLSRHERTLHADGQEQLQDQREDSPQEYVADEVNVAWTPSARPAPREPGADRNPTAQGEAANESAPRNRHLPLPGGEGDFSLSSSNATSSSDPAIILAGRGPSELSATSWEAQSDDMAAAPSTTAPPHTTTRQTITSKTTINTSTTDNQPQFTTTIYPAAREHDTVPIDPDLFPTAMALDDEIPSGQADDGPVSPHRQLDHHRAGPSAPLDQGQDSVPFSFSPLPDCDLDFAGFIFSPLPGHIMEIGHDQRNPQMTMTADFRFQPLQVQDFETAFDPIHPPARAIPDSSTNESCAAHPDITAPSDTAPSDTCDIPLLLQDERQPQPVLALDDATYLSIRSDLMQRLAVSNSEIDIPAAKACQAFLSSYVANFHGHLPIIHLQTLCPKTTPSPLLLAMCSIGALYRLDRRRARVLYDIASRSVETIVCPTPDDDKALVKEYSLWYVQARALLSFYGIMSGEQDLVLRTMHGNGFYTLVFNKARAALGVDQTSLSCMTWSDWVEHESWKRLIGCLLIQSTLTMVIFDVNPGFNASRDLEFEAFHDDSLWDAKSSNEWHKLQTSSPKQLQNLSPRTMKQVFVDIMLQGRHQSSTAPYQVSIFSALVLMHAVVVHMWQRLQFSQALSTPGYDSSFSTSSHDQLGRSLLDSAMKSLARCEIFLQRAKGDVGQADMDAGRELSLVFNCQAILRIAYIRLFKPASPSNHINLLSLDALDRDTSITSFVMTEMERSTPLLDTVIKCFEGLRIPVELGHLLVRKTAAFRWSIEHAIAGWESALLVTKWVHSVEISTLNGIQPNLRERELLTLIREVLQDAEYDLSENVSLAAGVASTWGWLLKDVWVWGITLRMGSMLGLLAKTYERVNKGNRCHSLDTRS